MTYDSRVDHDWIRDPLGLETRRECRRCGTVEVDCERNLRGSQSTMTWNEYFKNGKHYDSDPGCCERNV